MAKNYSSSNNSNASTQNMNNRNASTSNESNKY